jgi:hypothetical protein
LPVIPVLQRLRQEDHKFEASLGYTDPISKKKKRVDFRVTPLSVK